MDKCREAFEKKFPIPAHWIEFDEKRNKYYCPYVADAKASEYQEMWEVWQSRQAEVDALNDNHLAYIDKVIAMESDYLEKIEEKDKWIEELESAIKHLSGAIHKSISYEHDLFDKGWNECAERVVEDIYRLTGIGKGMRGEHE